MLVSIEQMHEAKYREALNSIKEGTQWVDNEGMVFTVLSKAKGFVAFKSDKYGFIIERTESDFLHTWVKKD